MDSDRDLDMWIDIGCVWMVTRQIDGDLERFN